MSTIELPAFPSFWLWFYYAVAPLAALAGLIGLAFWAWDRWFADRVASWNTARALNRAERLARRWSNFERQRANVPILIAQVGRAGLGMAWGAIQIIIVVVLFTVGSMLFWRPADERSWDDHSFLFFLVVVLGFGWLQLMFAEATISRSHNKSYRILGDERARHPDPRLSPTGGCRPHRH